MLTITRRPNETVIIDGHIEVKVLRVKGRQVRLGIKAPETVEILREEIFERIQKEIEQHQKHEARKVGNM